MCFMENRRKNHLHEWDTVFPIPVIGIKLASLIAFVFGILSFHNSIHGNFVFDDSEAVVNNQDVLVENPVSTIFYNDFWGTPLSHNRSHKSYRPLTVMTFRWNHWIAGGMHPYGFHVTNVLLHGIVSALVVPVAYNIFGRKSNQLSFMTSLLFAVHPVHTEAVAGIVGRADLLCCLFSFLSFLIYIRATESCTVLTSAVYLIGSILLSTLALLSKEQGITILGMCVAYEMIFIHNIDTYCVLYCVKDVFHSQSRGPNIKSLLLSERILNFSEDKRKSKIVFKSMIIRIFVLLASCVLLLYARWLIMGSKPPTFQLVDNPASFADNLWTRTLTYNYLYSLNVWLLLCPEWSSFDWSMGCIPLLSNIYDHRIFAVVLFWTSFLALLWRGTVSSNSEIGRVVNMALIATILPFLPASNIFFRVGFVLAERVLYLPSLGFCVLIVLGMHNILHQRPQLKNAVFVGFCCILLVFSARSIKRTNEWLEEQTLFKSALTVCPLNAKVHYNVAKNAGDIGNHDLAVKEYKIALALHPEYDQAMNNLANILRDRGKLSEAESLLRKAIQIRPDFAAAWMNLGIVLAGKKQHKEAEKSYTTALLHRSKYPECLYNLGNLYLDLKMYSKALNVFQEAVKQRPKFPIAWNNMVIMLEATGNLMEAKKVANEALLILPNDPGLHFNLANTLGKMGHFSDAEVHFKKALEFAPLSAIYHSNMGVLYHRWKKYDLAEAKYRDALRIDPHLKSAVTNLAMLKSKGY